jgi:hypothetical protein
MRHNRLRELLREGRPSIGTHLATSWPSIVELVGRSRMFTREFVAECAPYGPLRGSEPRGAPSGFPPHMAGW